MNVHIVPVTRAGARPAQAFDGGDLVKYLTQVLNLVNGFLDTAQTWQALRGSKEETQT